MKRPGALHAVALAVLLPACATFRLKDTPPLKESPKAAAPLAHSVSLSAREAGFLGGAGTVRSMLNQAVSESGTFDIIVVTDSTETASATGYRLESYLRIENPGHRVFEYGAAMITGFTFFIVPSWDTYNIVNTMTLWFNGSQEPVWTKTYVEPMRLMQWILFVPCLLYPPVWNGQANFRAIQNTFREGMTDLIHDFPTFTTESSTPSQ